MFTDGQTDRQTMDDRHSEKPTWAFRSGELKMWKVYRQTDGRTEGWMDNKQSEKLNNLRKVNLQLIDRNEFGFIPNQLLPLHQKWKIK